MAWNSALFPTDSITVMGEHNPQSSVLAALLEPGDYDPTRQFMYFSHLSPSHGWVTQGFQCKFAWMQTIMMILNAVESLSK